VSVAVRTAVAGRDVTALAGLRWAWAVEKGEAPAGETDPAFVERFAAWWAGQARTHVAFLASDGVTPIGMAWLAIAERVPDVARPVRRSGLVQSVFVVAPRRDAGVGDRLMASLLDRARAERLDDLLVHPSARSVRFYERLGFTGSDRLTLDLR
jgi:GNAT superfamily N-acetyltransferase